MPPLCKALQCTVHCHRERNTGLIVPLTDKLTVSEAHILSQRLYGGLPVLRKLKRTWWLGKAKK